MTDNKTGSIDALHTAYITKTVVEVVTLRDQFAMAALSALSHNDIAINPSAYAKIAYIVADSMMGARNDRDC